MTEHPELIHQHKASRSMSGPARLDRPCDVQTLRLVARESAITVRDAAGSLGMTTAGAQNRMTRLLRAGFVERKRIGECAPIYVLTDAGRKALKEID